MELIKVTKKSEKLSIKDKKGKNYVYTSVRYIVSLTEKEYIAIRNKEAEKEISK